MSLLPAPCNGVKQQELSALCSTTSRLIDLVAMQGTDLIPGILSGSIPFHLPHSPLDVTKLLPGSFPSSILQSTRTTASALGAPSPSTSLQATEEQQSIQPASLAALTLQSVAGIRGGPSVETLQALPKIPTPLETVSRANANAAQLQSYISAAAKENSGR